MILVKSDLVILSGFGLPRHRTLTIFIKSAFVTSSGSLSSFSIKYRICFSKGSSLRAKKTHGLVIQQHLDLTASSGNNLPSNCVHYECSKLNGLKQILMSDVVCSYWRNYRTTKMNGRIDFPAPSLCMCGESIEIAVQNKDGATS